MVSKKREGIVYSTNPDFNYEKSEKSEELTLSPNQQVLYVWLDAKGRKGKTVTLIKGFKGSATDLDVLATEIKKSCGTGGAVKEGDIVIQGDFRDKIMAFLSAKGYKAKRAGR
jgi:translation initiation factor 1